MAHLCAYIDREIGQCFVIQRLPQDQSTFQGVYEHEVILKKKKKKMFRKDLFHPRDQENVKWYRVWSRQNCILYGRKWSRLISIHGSYTLKNPRTHHRHLLSTIIINKEKKIYICNIYGSYILKNIYHLYQLSTIIINNYKDIYI